jgi:hypothetical protein
VKWDFILFFSPKKFIFPLPKGKLEMKEENTVSRFATESNAP